eukprot:266577_1
MFTKQLVSPTKLKELESKFAATLVVSSLLSKRGIPCTITNLSKQVSKMCNNNELTLTDLQMIHNILPSICWIRTTFPDDQIQITNNNNNNTNNKKNDNNDFYELKFSFPITPNNIGKLLNQFKKAISQKQNESKNKRKLSENNENTHENALPRKKRKLSHNHNHNNSNNNNNNNNNDEDTIELNLKPLPPKDISKASKELKQVEFDPLTFIEESKNFTFWSDGNIVSHRVLPAKLPRYDKLQLGDNQNDINNAPTPIRITEIPSILVSTYKNSKNLDIINKLYCHQRNGIESICNGYHNIIATATSSGKSLIYNIPVLSYIINNNYKSQNLYLFPTKALAHDQLRSLNTICNNINISCECYDGDTPFNVRRNILECTNIILTNPDIIHQTLLPNHSKYKTLFSNISFIIIDESHCYSSVFGSHCSNIIRRLKRICSLYNSYPLFIGCSATINNPLQHFSNLTGIKQMDINLIDDQHDSSSNGEKLFIFWQPPLKKGYRKKSRNKKKKENEKNDTKNDKYFHIENHLKTVANAKNDSASRKSAFIESAMLFSQCIMSDLRCILFVQQRSVVELVYKYSRDILFKSDINGKNYMNLIKSYRGGYNKQLRRRIESDLFNNNILGIISTNAMELGIDIGDLDCTLHIGYSGLSSLWQQSGRSGRNGKPSLAIFIAQNSVIDQYIINHNNILFDSSFENVIIYPFNKRILYLHLLCSIADEPMDKNEMYIFWNNNNQNDEYENCKLLIDEIVNELIYDAKIMLKKDINKFILTPKYLSILAYKLHKGNDNIPNYSNHIHPAKFVGIRNIDPNNYGVYIEGINLKLDEMDERNAFFHVYPGAIYLNQGKEYLITNLDIKSHKVYCKQISYSKYYTYSRDRTDILITNNLFTSYEYNKLIHFGKVEIRTKVFAFYKITKLSQDILDEKPLMLPNLITPTVAFWIDIPVKIINVMNKKNIDIISAIHAIEHCMISLIPLFIKCNSKQFDTECPSPFDTKKRVPRIIIAEKIQNGLGYVKEIILNKNKKNIIKELVNKTIETFENCPCIDDEGE